MTRLDRFNALKDHAWLGKSYKKLSQNEIDMAKAFIKQTENLDNNSYATMAVRIWLDKPKPKNWTRIEELLIACL